MKRIYNKYIVFLFLLVPISTAAQSVPFLGLWPDPAVLAMGGTSSVATTSAFLCTTTAQLPFGQRVKGQHKHLIHCGKQDVLTI